MRFTLQLCTHVESVFLEPPKLDPRWASLDRTMLEDVQFLTDIFAAGDAAFPPRHPNARCKVKP